MPRGRDLMGAAWGQAWAVSSSKGLIEVLQGDKTQVRRRVKGQGMRLGRWTAGVVAGTCAVMCGRIHILCLCGY